MDLKKTTYKKLGKLLSVFERKGLLTQKLVHKQEHLATVNRDHALYTAFAALHGGAGAQVFPRFCQHWCLHSPRRAARLARSQYNHPPERSSLLRHRSSVSAKVRYVMLRAPG